jgi:hypothetical protein
VNNLEQLIFNSLKKNQRLKGIIRDIYQNVMFIFPQEKENTMFEIVSRPGYFFGFHDKSPWSPDNQLLLSHNFSNDLIDIQKEDFFKIGYFQGTEFTKFESIGQSSSINWQQGSMLQWLGNTGNIIYNDVVKDRNVARIIDLNGKIIDNLPGAISHVSPDGRFAVGYSFERLQKYAPGYGYAHGKDDALYEKIPSNHGLMLYDLNHGTEKLLFSIKDLCEQFPDQKMEASFNFITHCLFSPDGKRFLFLHRGIKNMNYISTRLFTCNTDGRDLFLFPTNYMVSHLAWRNNSQILAYCSVKNENDSYILFNDQKETYEVVGKSFFTSDGHPSFCPTNLDWFVTDTYPDRLRNSRLMLFDMKNQKKYTLARLRQPLKYKEELRCDLHPRWDRKGEYLCFDSAHLGKRSLCTMKIENLSNVLKIFTEYEK